MLSCVLYILYIIVESLSRFYIIYCVGMIIIMFGLFNIITAIFVDSTISGIKY